MVKLGRRGLILSAAALGLLGAGAVLAALWADSLRLTSPPEYSQPDAATFKYQQTPKSEAGLDYVDLSATVGGKAVVRGWLVPADGDAKKLGVIVLHGRGGDRRFGLQYLPMLHDLGAGVALIDLRENGLSDGSGRGMTFGSRESDDAMATARELRRLGYGRIVLVGCSLGAVTAVLAAADNPDIDGVVAESVVANYNDFVADTTATRLGRHGVHLPRWILRAWGDVVLTLAQARQGVGKVEAVQDAIHRIGPRPLLLIQGGRDTMTLPGYASPLLRRAGPNASLLTAPDAEHCEAYSRSPAAYRRGVERLLGQLPSSPLSSPSAVEPSRR